MAEQFDLVFHDLSLN